MKELKKGTIDNRMLKAKPVHKGSLYELWVMGMTAAYISHLTMGIKLLQEDKGHDFCF